MKRLGFILCCVVLTHGDLYITNPRGSNNRLNGNGREVRNNKRLFDSQNNNRGGYNVGDPMYYYEGSTLSIEWANQHSCADQNANCELILQYMCDDKIRDGRTTRTIRDNQDRNTGFGMHEEWQHYLYCRTRRRNQGLFLADQNLGRNDARYTRQNAGGTKRGYECPEERDYYPYWHHSPWKDIAVLTNDVERCDYYQQESFNVKSRWSCVIDRNQLNRYYRRNIVIPDNKEDCENFKIRGRSVGAQWTEFPAHGLPPPQCIKAPWSRDNHNGNGIGGNFNTYDWVIPEGIAHEKCVLRMRYNISTNDYDSWNTDASSNTDSDTDGSKIDLLKTFNFPDQETAEARGYVFQNNPDVEVFPDLDVKLALAINTAQFGRTFQDRSHVFEIRQRPAELKDVTIHNLNVRGKRGNNQQVYPAVEYDFVPNTLEINTNDFVHIQWTGSDRNPRNNAGNGRRGTDRNNMVMLKNKVYPEGTPGLAYGGLDVLGQYGANYPMHLDNVTRLIGASTETRAVLQKMALLAPPRYSGSMVLLDNAKAYYDVGPLQFAKEGVFHFMCTRNNAFTNRSQKGRIIVRDASSK
ncbi:protein DD3-3 [Lingula anatina]|uniref:Protein DD3-3 n=1 Tax=Lingula anatina TaxID=7574 RepID=A0A1S3I2N4_LINAN|nr:protein DD3-3 [Lingula anatina]|eukprot:XP_013392086.1 protein DD3-3 [Lingula anatina]